MLAVLKKEFKSYFITPVGYVFMGLFLLIGGITFVAGNIFTLSENFAAGTLGSLIFIFILVIPLLTMRIFTEEQRQGTEKLLMTAPLPTGQIVLGKFLGSVLIFLLTLMITVIYPIILSFHGRLEWPVIIGSYIGFFLLGCAFTSIGVYVSSLTESQASAAVVTLFLILITWLIDSISAHMPTSITSGVIFLLSLTLMLALYVYNSSQNLPVALLALGTGVLTTAVIFLMSRQIYIGLISNILKWFSLTSRFYNFPRGILKLSDIIYYLSFCGFFLFLTNRRIERKRWS
jgi:ABC-2 type transport system permease protein